MDHVAIDLGGRESQICVRSGDGDVVEETRWSTRGLRNYLEKRPPSRVVLETCAEAFGVADMAIALGHDVRVVPSVLVPALGVGSRKTKNDVRDARILSEASCRIELPSVHIPSKDSRRRKTICGMREALIASRTQLINTARGWLRAEGIAIRMGASETFPLRVSTAVVTAMPACVERQLKAIDALTSQILAADSELKQLAKVDPTAALLMSVPGVGPVTAIRFAAALDDVKRFGSAHDVEAYLGLTPGEWSSSDRKRRTSITKAGPPAVRRTLVQAAWAARRSRPSDPMVLWSLEVEKRRGKRIAVIALARKMAGVLYAIWRDGTLYNARHVAPRTVTT